MLENHKLIKREVLYIQVQFTSPLSVSSGENEWTDSDVLRDADGNPFVAGSSLAGAIRAYLGMRKNDNCFMGFSRRENNGKDHGKMSSLFISDMIFEDESKSGIRDGVALDYNKTAMDGSKFDTEIIEALAKAHFYMELTIREEDNEEQMHHALAQIFYGINQSEIRLGSKKTRGFGEFKVLSVKCKSYGKDNFLDYADAYIGDNWKDESEYLDQWLAYAQVPCNMIHIDIPLRMKGGISIRCYAARKEEPDYVHLTDHGVPVIPGSSLAGALRHRTKQILEELKTAGATLPESIDEITDAAFGYVNETEACSSNIIIGETEIKNARSLTIVRTGVSRFESAVKQGALYKEKTYVDGELKVQIMIRKGNNFADERWILGLLLLAIRDLQNGFLAVGGQTAIGRGIFESNGPVTIDGEEGTEEKFIKKMLSNMAEKGVSR